MGGKLNIGAVASLDEYRHLAQSRLAQPVLDYLEDGGSAENERAFAAVRLMPRVLGNVRGGHTRLTLFGQTLEHPLLLAPVAYQRLFHPDGETAAVMAAAAQGGQSIVSSLSSQPFEPVFTAARETGRHAPWFQLYWQGDRPRTRRLLQRAAAAGCTAVVFTVDAPIKRATLVLPDDVQAVNLEAEAGIADKAEGSRVFDGWMLQSPLWQDIEWLRRETALPLLIKGILNPDDAARAVDAGCDGIVVSNHGGRVLDGAIASLPALPGVVTRISGRVPVLFDGGIRRGRDIFAALALGAHAVLLGRPFIRGLAANGAMGVAHTIRLLRDELEMTMALTGCAVLADIDQSRFAPREFDAPSRKNPEGNTPA